MLAFEKVCLDEKPDIVLVVGDVNSTVACSLVASKLGIRIAHVEAGLRSYDRSMPEEINRVLTDAISDYLFTTCEDAAANLLKEGIAENKIRFVGNVMIDTLLSFKQKSEGSPILKQLGLEQSSGSLRDFALLTLHRPSNVDNRENFMRIVQALQNVAERLPVIFPIHPRTRKQIESFEMNAHFNFNAGAQPALNGIVCIEPLSYLDFLKLMSHSRLALTDSGGIQEETTILGVPCITLRENTERPVTITEGTNELAGTDPVLINKYAADILGGTWKKGRRPKLWDGSAAERIVGVLLGS
jgi:UDP-N-acetylglucosamine 2-epimerase (non-hydrolysing)